MTTASQGERLALFGGAFDPPHLAHRALVQAALSQLGLAKVHVVPTGQAWHRREQPHASAQHRLAMARLAFAGLPQVVVDDVEVQRHGPSYTIDTLETLSARAPQAQWHLLLGLDQWRSLAAWHRIADLARQVVFVVAQRDPDVPVWSPSAMDASSVPPGWRVQGLDMPLWPVRATDIRHRIQQGWPVDGLLSHEVARYIRDHRLYLSDPESP